LNGWVADIILYLAFNISKVLEVMKAPYGWLSETTDTNQDANRDSLTSLGREQLIDLLCFQIRNIWRVDGLYFLGIERRFGTEAAAGIDEQCWKTMGKLEARQLKEMLGPANGSVLEFMKRLGLTSWALDQEDRQVEVHNDRGVFRVLGCGTQLTRIRKGLTEFPCRPVREGYLKAFAEEFDPSLTVNCKTCPPGPHSSGVWCEWEFVKSR